MKRIFLYNEKYAQSVIVEAIIFRKVEALTKKNVFYANLYGGNMKHTAIMTIKARILCF